MNIVCWNCRGVLSPSFESFLGVISDLVQAYAPAIMVISETKVSDLKAKSITDRMSLDGAIHANNFGLSGGLWVLWDSNKVEVTELSSIEQEIHYMIKDLSSGVSWLLIAVYASPRFAKRWLLWENLASVANLHDLPWVIAGDFNKVLNAEEKFGGRAVDFQRALRFQDCLNHCRMIDLGLSGPKFTWSKNLPLTQLIQERMIMCLSNIGGMFCILKQVCNI